MRNPDILAGLVADRAARRDPRPYLVGFAAETGDDTGSALELARVKMRRKGCDLLVANEVGINKVFGADSNTVHLLYADGQPERTVGPASKVQVAETVWDGIQAALGERDRGEQCLGESTRSALRLRPSARPEGTCPLDWTSAPPDFAESGEPPLSARLFTSESVTEGHPDKICDQISDAILDAMLEQDPRSRVAVETMVTTGLVHVAGEVTTEAYVEIPRIVRDTVLEIGYDSSTKGFDGASCGVSVSIGQQSPDIAQGVDTAYENRVGENIDMYDKQGAGDQGLMFGFACMDTPEFMPLPIFLAHRLSERLSMVRKSQDVPYLRPDGKTQVTIAYEGDKAVRLDTVVVSTQHAVDISLDGLLAPDIISEVIEPVLADLKESGSDLDVSGYRTLINPTGRFEIGGPMGDAGLTGRKIIVDTYGGMARHGGGAFSGKDPSKVDRSAAYATRWVAKNVVAAGLATRCEIQVAYAIGAAHPVGLYVETFGTETVPVQQYPDRDRVGVRPASGCHHRPARPAPADLPGNRGIRALRAHPGRRRREPVHLGAHRPGRRAARRGSLT